MVWRTLVIPQTWGADLRVMHRLPRPLLLAILRHNNGYRKLTDRHLHRRTHRHPHRAKAMRRGQLTHHFHSLFSMPQLL